MDEQAANLRLLEGVVEPFAVNCGAGPMPGDFEAASYSIDIQDFADRVIAPAERSLDETFWRLYYETLGAA